MTSNSGNNGTNQRPPYVSPYPCPWSVPARSSSPSSSAASSATPTSCAPSSSGAPASFLAFSFPRSTPSARTYTSSGITRTWYGAIVDDMTPVSPRQVSIGLQQRREQQQMMPPPPPPPLPPPPQGGTNVPRFGLRQATEHTMESQTAGPAAQSTVRQFVAPSTPGATDTQAPSVGVVTTNNDRRSAGSKERSLATQQATQAPHRAPGEAESAALVLRTRLAPVEPQPTEREGNLLPHQGRLVRQVQPAPRAELQLPPYRDLRRSDLLGSPAWVPPPVPPQPSTFVWMAHVPPLSPPRGVRRRRRDADEDADAEGESPRSGAASESVPTVLESGSAAAREDRGVGDSAARAGTNPFEKQAQELLDSLRHDLPDLDVWRRAQFSAASADAPADEPEPLVDEEDDRQEGRLEAGHSAERNQDGDAPVLNPTRPRVEVRARLRETRSVLDFSVPQRALVSGSLGEQSSRGNLEREVGGLVPAAWERGGPLLARQAAVDWDSLSRLCDVVDDFVSFQAQRERTLLRSPPLVRETLASVPMARQPSSQAYFTRPYQPVEQPTRDQGPASWIVQMVDRFVARMARRVRRVVAQGQEGRPNHRVSPDDPLPPPRGSQEDADAEDDATREEPAPVLQPQSPSMQVSDTCQEPEVPMTASIDAGPHCDGPLELSAHSGPPAPTSSPVQSTPVRVDPTPERRLEALQTPHSRVRTRSGTPFTPRSHTPSMEAELRQRRLDSLTRGRTSDSVFLPAQAPMAEAPTHAANPNATSSGSPLRRSRPRVASYPSPFKNDRTLANSMYRSAMPRDIPRSASAAPRSSQQSNTEEGHDDDNDIPDVDVELPR